MKFPSKLWKSAYYLTDRQSARHLSHGEKRSIVLSIGNIDTFRGLQILLQVIKIVEKEIRNEKLWIIDKQGSLSRYVGENDKIKEMKDGGLEASLCYKSLFNAQGAS